VIVVNRFRVPESDHEAFRGDLERARETLARQSGYVRGRIGRNVDDVLSRAMDEPSAYETVEPGTELNRPGARSLG
jgi:hypothetical protein